MIWLSLPLILITGFVFCALIPSVSLGVTYAQTDSHRAICGWSRPVRHHVCNCQAVTKQAAHVSSYSGAHDAVSRIPDQLDRLGGTL